MIKKALISMLGIVLFAASLSGRSPQGKPASTLFNTTPQSHENTAQMVGSGQVLQSSLQHRDSRYQLTEGDVLDLNFPFTPSFNQTVTVLPDGYVSLRGVGSLRVEGETVPEVRSTLQRAYSKILRDPVITVALKDFEKPYFIVGGQVQHPGKFDLHGDTTVMQAVEIAGGFNDNAKHSQILLFHRVSAGWVEVKKLNLKALLQGKDLSEDPHLKPGDMLFVPKNVVSKIKQFIPSMGTGIYYNPTHF